MDYHKGHCFLSPNLVLDHCGADMWSQKHEIQMNKPLLSGVKISIKENNKQNESLGGKKKS